MCCRYSECVQLANANKVNKHNAWSLHLIDHIEEVKKKGIQACLRFCKVIETARDLEDEVLYLLVCCVLPLLLF